MMKIVKSEQGAPCMKDINGIVQPASRTADVRADFLDSKLWAKPSEEELKELQVPRGLKNIRLAPLDVSLQSPLSWGETRSALLAQQDNK